MPDKFQNQCHVQTSHSCTFLTWQFHNRNPGRDLLGQRLQAISILSYIRVMLDKNRVALKWFPDGLKCGWPSQVLSVASDLSWPCSSFLLLGHSSMQRIAALRNHFHSLPASNMLPQPSFPHQHTFLWLKYSKHKASAAHTKCHLGEAQWMRCLCNATSPKHICQRFWLRLQRRGGINSMERLAMKPSDQYPCASFEGDTGCLLVQPAFTWRCLTTHSSHFF